ncbi:MAG: phenylalanine--tRNA ligase subunit beta [Alphaproteobacteria bacterium]|nr:phenylalanine--tRNA ligase subunit beta [Alphaproteobacteria bacterium]
MKFTLSWLKEHLDTSASLDQVVAAMTMAGLEVEHVIDPASRLAAFTSARIVEAVQHPNADRLRVCQVETRDGMKEIVCGAPNARAGLVTLYAPIGTYIPGTGITLEPRPVRGVVSNGMLCSAAELELAEESDGIMELDGGLAVGVPAATALGLEAVIDFEVTPNRPDWLGVAGIARDLAAAGLGRLITPPAAPLPGRFPCPVQIRLTAPKACPAFAGRLIRGVRNGPSPDWLQQKLKAIGLRSISALVDVTNLLSYDRCRPLHVYDAAKLQGGYVEARLGREGESFVALDGKTYAVGPDMCVIADASGPLGLGGVMGGESTGCSEATTEVFIESAWFDPLRTAQTGRDTGILSDAQYRFARGVDPASLRDGIELATALILDLCGGEASDVLMVGEAPAPPAPVAFDPAYVKRLSGLDLTNDRIFSILEALGFAREGEVVHVPSWRRDVEGRADLVEEVARIAGFDALPATPLPAMERPAGGVLTPRQGRIRTARRALAALGYEETLTFSFIARRTAELFGGGSERLVLANPIASDLDCMRPSILPSLAQALARNAHRGFPGGALFEIGPIFEGDAPADQKTVITAALDPRQPRRWDGLAPEPLFALKSDLLSLLVEIGAPVDSLQVAQGDLPPWWRTGRAARLVLGRNAIATFGELHPRALKALDVDHAVLAFEIALEAIPEPKRKAVRTKTAVKLSPLMPLSRDFAFVVSRETAAAEIVRAAQSADRQLIVETRVFDIYEGPGVEAGCKSVAIETVFQPTARTLTDAEIEATAAKIVAAVAKATGARLRG